MVVMVMVWDVVVEEAFEVVEGTVLQWRGR